MYDASRGIRHGTGRDKQKADMRSLAGYRLAWDARVGSRQVFQLINELFRGNSGFVAFPHPVYFAASASKSALSVFEMRQIFV